MEFDWRVYDYNQKFFGESSPHTRLSLAIMTPHGRVKLQLRVVWNVPLRRFSAIYPHLAGELLIRNYCRTFTVILPSNPSEILLARTLEYFDGAGRILKPVSGATALFCDRKWLMSARWTMNRYGVNKAKNVLALRNFMQRRLTNAYGSLYA